MGTRDPRVDAYIKQSAPFAQPIIAHLRAAVHEACPDVVETVKWKSPSFEHHGILCGMAAFKSHCAFGFWKHELVTGEERSQEAMGSFGRLTSTRELPSTSTSPGESVFGSVRARFGSCSCAARSRRGASPDRPPFRRRSG